MLVRQQPVEAIFPTTVLYGCRFEAYTSKHANLWKCGESNGVLSPGLFSSKFVQW